MGISGTGVAMATAGAVLVYAGLTKQNPLAALRAVGSGSPASVSTTPAGSGATSGTPSWLAPIPTAGQSPIPQLVTAAYAHSHEKYSQAKRWQDGYSDCSSFVGKAFKDIGITPPGASVTGSYLTWSALSKIPLADVGPGDLLCNSTHIVICVNSTTAIGQENPRRNVVVGPFSDLMAGTGSYVALRYGGNTGALSQVKNQKQHKGLIP